MLLRKAMLPNVIIGRIRGDSPRTSLSVCATCCRSSSLQNVSATGFLVCADLHQINHFVLHFIRLLLLLLHGATVLIFELWPIIPVSREGWLLGYDYHVVSEEAAKGTRHYHHTSTKYLSYRAAHTGVMLVIKKCLGQKGIISLMCYVQKMLKRIYLSSLNLGISFGKRLTLFLIPCMT